MGIPVGYWGAVISYDTGKNVARNDYPRMAILATYWIEWALIEFDVFLQYYSEMAALDTFQAKVINMVRDAAAVANNVARVNIMIGNNIVGMLSSSYQGSSIEDRKN